LQVGPYFEGGHFGIDGGCEDEDDVVGVGIAVGDDPCEDGGTTGGTGDAGGAAGGAAGG